MYPVLPGDNDPALREILMAFLNRRETAATAAGGGQECFDPVKTRTPDLVLADQIVERACGNGYPGGA
jgi:CheY-like chemotaxis protein